MPEYRIPDIESLPAPGSVAPRRIVFVVHPTASSLEYMGPLQVFDEARIFFEHAGRMDLAYQIEVVSTGSGPVYERKGFAIQAPSTFDKLRGPVDTLIFQAVDEHDACMADDRFIRWVSRMSGKVRRCVSICTGSFVLGQAGVLDGRRATTHWCAFEDFQRRFPNTTLDPDAIYVKDGHVYTSAGATSGMDLAIALVEEDFGAEFARRVAQGLVMFLRRPAYQSQYSVHVTTEPTDHRMQEVTAYITDNLHGDLRIESLAGRFNMSPRTFIRTFTRAAGVAPGRYVEQCRLERARFLLEESDLPISQVAAACGYASADGLRLVFERNLSTTPRGYRNRFTSAVIRNAVQGKGKAAAKHVSAG